MKKTVRKTLKLIIKISIGVFLLFLLINRIHLNELITNIKKINLYFFIWGTCCFIGIILTQAFRHYVLLKTYFLSYPVTLKLVLMGFFFNHLLPTHVGGDVYKIYYLKKRNISLGEATAFITLDRITALAVILFSGLTVLIVRFNFLSNLVQEKGIHLYLNIRMLIIAFLLITASIGFLVWINKSVRIFSRIKIEGAAAIHALKKLPAFRYLQIILLSFMTFIFRISKFYFFILCFQEMIPIPNLIIVVLAANFLPLLPISIGGLGVLEGTLFLGFTFFGLSETAAVGTALLNRFVAWILALFGGFLYLGNSKKGDKHHP